MRRNQARALGFEPVVRFDGAIDSSVEGSTADRTDRGLSAKRSRTSPATPEHRPPKCTSPARDGMLTLTVSDDGVGQGEVSRPGRGLDNMRTRAGPARRSRSSCERATEVEAELVWRVFLDGR